MTNFELTDDGIQLLNGFTWQDADHFNITTQEGTLNFHTEAKCSIEPAPIECSPIMISAAQNVGNDLILWETIGLEPGDCVSWVQFSRDNYHFGAQGEEEFCIPTTDIPEEPEEPEVTNPPVPEGLMPTFKCEDNPAASICQVDTPPSPELAATGFDPSYGFLGALLLIVVGASTFVIRRKTN